MSCAFDLCHQVKLSPSYITHAVTQSVASAPKAYFGKTMSQLLSDGLGTANAAPSSSIPRTN